MEHHSNIVPWHFHRERKGAVIKWAPVTDDGDFILDEFEKLLTAADEDRRDHPHVERAGHGRAGEGDRCASPMRAAFRCWSTAARAPCIMPVDVRDLGCDFYAFTGHKLYGPTGIGVLYGKRDLLNAMPPFIGGGEMIRDVTTDDVTYAEPPHRFEAGTPPIVQAIGLGAAHRLCRGPRPRAHRGPRGRRFATTPTSACARINSLRIYRHGAGQGRHRLVQDGRRPCA